MTPHRIKRIFATLKKNNPEPTTELVYNSPFELLIAVMLSAQATDISVNKATKGLFAEANTAQAMLDLGIKKITQHIKSIGLYKNKAKFIMATCTILQAQHQGSVPQSRDALEALPGVGRKTANVVLNTAFGEPTLAVDTHIFRVSRRMGLADGNTPLKVEQQLLKVIPSTYLNDAHHWLILHGRYTCTARKPKCPDCPVKTWCEYPDKTTNL